LKEYGKTEDMDFRVATWDFVHEQQPIWDLKTNSAGQLLSVGSDQSVAMWQAPNLDTIYERHDDLETLNDPSEFLLGRFRKVGKLGHFLTPTSACWLSNSNQFAVSYRESIV